MSLNEEERAIMVQHEFEKARETLFSLITYHPLVSTPLSKG